MKHRVVYIAHPLGPDGPEREKNRENAARWVAWLAAEFFIAPIADWIILSGEWPEDPAFRERGLDIDVVLVQRADEVWMVGGRVSTGMRLEGAAAEQIGKPVHDLTGLGFEAPTIGNGVEMHDRVAAIVGLP